MRVIIAAKILMQPLYKPVPYDHDLALLLFRAVKSRPKENMIASNPFEYSHWN